MTVPETMERLSAQLYAYSVFQRLMGDVPTRELFDALDAEVLRDSFELLGALPSQDVEALLDLIAAGDLDFEQLKSEYNRIFVGPAALPAPPWESVYRDGKRVVMTVTTLNVREFYKAYGFQAVRHHHVPDDHIAIELDFLAALTAEALQACQTGDVETAANREQAAATFAREHLGAWAGLFAADVRNRANAPFYAAAAEALVALLEAITR